MLFANTPNPGTPGTPGSAEDQEPVNKSGEVKKNIEAYKMDSLPVHIKRYYDQESWFIEQVKKMVPGNEGKSYGPGERDEVEGHWTNMQKEYNGLQGFINHFTELRKLIESPDFDPKHERWKGRFEPVFASFAELENMEGLGLSDDRINSLKNAKNATKEALLADLKDIISAFIQMRADILQRIEQQMAKDFKKRLKYLRRKWERETPRGYECRKDQWLAYIDAGIEDVKHLPELMEGEPEFNHADKRIEAYGDVWKYLERLEDFYENANQGKNYEFSIDKLMMEFNDLQKLKETEVDPIAAEYAHKVDTIVPELEALLKTVRAQDAKGKDDEETKQIEDKKRLQEEEIERTIKNLREGKDIKQMFHNALFSDEALMVQDPAHPDDKNAKIPCKFRIGTEEGIPLQRGLINQIEMLQKIPFTKEEQRQFALGVKQAMARCREEILSMKKQANEGLPDILNRIRVKESELKELHPEGKGLLDRYKFVGLAPADINQVIHIIQEFATRRYDRVSKGRVGDFGEKTLKFLQKAPYPLGVLRGVPAEFGKESEHAQHAEYTHFKDIYAAHDMFHVEHIAYETSNPDELRGCLLLLSENGRLNWYNPKLWKQLNRFQKDVQIPMDVRYNLSNFSKFQDSLRRACGSIWDFDAFNNMNNANNSAFESKKAAFSKDCDTWAEMGKLKGEDSGLGLVIGDMLRAHKADPHGAKTDPIKYEAIIDYAIAKGKMDPEGKLYYIIQGIANGILTPDRASVLDSKFVNDYPAIEYFHTATKRGSKPTMEDMKEVALMDMTQFYDWFHTHVMNLPAVYQRINKTLTQGNKLDHDDLTAYLAYMTEGTAKALLRAQGQGYLLPQTGVQNATVGMMFFMDHIAENYNNIGPNNKSELQRFVGSFIHFDGILSSKMYQSQGYYRWDPTALNEKPRSESNYQKLYGRSGMTCKENLRKVQNYIRILEPKVFGDLFDGKITTTDQVKGIVKYVTDTYGAKAFGTDTQGKPNPPPQTVDNLYELVGELAGYLARTENPNVAKMLNAIRADHEQAYASMKKADPSNAKTMDERRQDAAHELAEYQKKEMQKTLSGEAEKENRGEGDEHGHGGHGHAHKHKKRKPAKKGAGKDRAAEQGEGGGGGQGGAPAPH